MPLGTVRYGSGELLPAFSAFPDCVPGGTRQNSLGPPDEAPGCFLRSFKGESPPTLLFFPQFLLNPEIFIDARIDQEQRGQGREP